MVHGRRNVSNADTSGRNGQFRAAADRRPVNKPVTMALVSHARAGATPRPFAFAIVTLDHGGQ